MLGFSSTVTPLAWRAWAYIEASRTLSGKLNEPTTTFVAAASPEPDSDGAADAVVESGSELPQADNVSAAVRATAATPKIRLITENPFIIGG